MKLTAIILLIACLQVSANGVAQVSIRCTNASVKEVLNAIQKQTNYLLFYNEDILKGAKPVTLNVKNQPVDQVLKLALKGQPLDYRIEDKTIFIIRNSKLQEAINEQAVIQDTVPRLSISGKVQVADSGNAILPNVTVVNRNTKEITLTDQNGTFNILARKGDVLEISYVGMKMTRITVNDVANLLSVTLPHDIKEEEAVVVYNTGFEFIPKERATGSFVKVDNELLNRRMTTGIIDRLEGVTSGLLFDRRIDNATQQPKNNLQIRGLFTLTETIAQPLIILDNFPYTGDINNLNPNDIESITILRDAASASIWGAKAANGVIVLTSKAAKFNTPFRIDVMSNVTVTEKPDLFKLNILSPAEMIDVENFFFDKGAYDGNIGDPSYPSLTPVVEILNKLKNNEISQEEAHLQLNLLKANDVRNDFHKYVYRTGINQQHSLALTGGGKSYNYRISLGFDKNIDQLVGNGYDRTTINISNLFKPTKNLDVSVTAAYTIFNTENNSLGAYGAQAYNLNHSTLLPLYSRLADNNSNFLPIDYTYRARYTDTVGGGALLDWKYKPLEDQKQQDRTGKSNAFIGSANVKYRLFKWLSADAQFRFQNTARFNRDHYNKETFYTRNLINLFTNLNESDANLRYPVPRGGILDTRDLKVNSFGIRGSLSFNKEFGKHRINGILGGNIDQTKTSSYVFRTYGYSNNLNTSRVDYVTIFPQVNGLTATIPSMNDFGENVERLVSTFANIGYNFDGRYTFTASARRDASNLFGVKSNEKWSPFWSIGGSWSISNEKFYKLKFIESLSLRATYGNSGNVNNSLSAYTILMYSPSSQNSLVRIPYSSIWTFGNPELRWEKVSTANFALDWSLKRGVLSGSIEYYFRNSTDVIGSTPLDITTGASSIKANSADMKGTGWDIQIRSRIFNNRNFKWLASLNFSSVSYKVTKILQPTPTDMGYRSSGNLIAPIEGYSPYLVVSYKWAGLDPKTGDPLGVLSGKISKNYDSLVNYSPFSNQVVHGSALPTSFGNLLNSIDLFGFRLSLNLIYNFGYYFRKNTINYSSLVGGSSHIDYRRRWQQEGDERVTNIPSLQYPFNTNRELFFENSEVNVLPGDHIRLDDVQLSYLFGGNGRNIGFFKHASIFSNVSNLNIIVWKKNEEGVNPNAPMGNIAGKNFTFGIRATF